MIGEEKDRECDKTFVAGLRQRSLTIGDVSHRNYFTPIDQETGSAVYTHDDSDMSAPAIISPFNFTLSIQNFVMPFIGI